MAEWHSARLNPSLATALSCGGERRTDGVNAAELSFQPGFQPSIALQIKLKWQSTTASNPHPTLGLSGQGIAFTTPQLRDRLAAISRNLWIKPCIENSKFPSLPSPFGYSKFCCVAVMVVPGGRRISATTGIRRAARGETAATVPQQLPEAVGRGCSRPRGALKGRVKCIRRGCPP